MNYDEFTSTLSQTSPPSSLPPTLLALWHDARGNWDRAHEIAQDIPDPDGAWIHAYLHRKEGDTGNAAYWYRRAKRSAATGSLEAEWEAIVKAFLSGH